MKNANVNRSQPLSVAGKWGSSKVSGLTKDR